jgi:hypothetical protein
MGSVADAKKTNMMPSVRARLVWKGPIKLDFPRGFANIGRIPGPFPLIIREWNYLMRAGSTGRYVSLRKYQISSRSILSAVHEIDARPDIPMASHPFPVVGRLVSGFPTAMSRRKEVRTSLYSPAVRWKGDIAQPYAKSEELVSDPIGPLFRLLRGYGVDR